MNILVTGACGFVGTRLIRKLADCPRAYVFASLHDKEPNGFGAGFLSCDVTNYRRVLEIIVNFEIDQIYHLAAKSIVRNCRCDPLGCFETNIMGTANILEAARQSGRVKGILLMESDKSYGTGPVPYQEDQALNPGGVYEASKACVSHLMTTYHRNYDLPVFSVRSANVYGPGDRNMTRLIPNTIMRILRGERPQIVEGAADYVREFIYVDDVCECMIHLMQIADKGGSVCGQAINVGSGEAHAIGQVVQKICTIMDAPDFVDAWERPKTLTEIETQYLCLDKLRTLYLDYTPTPLVDGLRKTIDYYTLAYEDEE